MLLLSLSLLASSLYMQTVKAQTLLNSYDGGNIFDAPIQVPNYLGAGAAFSVPYDASISSISFELYRVGNPVGSLVVNIYSTGSMSTAPNANAVPLASSNTVDESTLSTSPTYVTFTFSTPFSASSSSNYNYIVCGSNNFDSNNYVELVCGASPPVGTALDLTVQKLSTYYISSNAHSADYILYGTFTGLATPTPIPYQTPTPTPTYSVNPTSTPYGATPTPIYNFPTPAPTSILSIEGYSFSLTDVLIILVAIAAIICCGVYIAHSLTPKRKHK